MTAVPASLAGPAFPAPTGPSTSRLAARTGPAASYPAARSYARGSAVAIACQTPGQKTGTTSLWDKLTDGTSYPVRGMLATGALAWVSCQHAGSKVGTTAVWDKLTNGRWITDYYISTFNKKTYSLPVPRC
jgi:hypothetical protein